MNNKIQHLGILIGYMNLVFSANKLQGYRKEGGYRLKET